MGAEFNSYEFPKGTKKKALSKLADAVFEQARYDYGHAGYSGSFAECDEVIIEDKSFLTEDAAYEWISDNADKWEPALIVTIQANKDDPPIYYMGAWCSS
jgi:hypothetical protein